MSNHSKDKPIAKLAGKVQWVQSLIAADKTFCIYYLAESEALVGEHSRLAGSRLPKLPKCRPLSTR